MIEFKHVSKTYPNGVKGLKDVNLKFEQGEFVAIIGLSGAGKSTLIRTINRMIDITEGELTGGRHRRFQALRQRRCASSAARSA